MKLTEPVDVMEIINMMLSILQDLFIEIFSEQILKNHLYRPDKLYETSFLSCAATIPQHYNKSLEIYEHNRKNGRSELYFCLFHALKFDADYCEAII